MDATILHSRFNLQQLMSNSNDLPSSPQELQQAFALFNKVSEQLTEAYAELQAKAEGLTQELAVANGALRQQYEEKEALSQRLSQLLDALPGGVVVLDAMGQVEEANPAAIHLLGGAIVGVPWSQIEEVLLEASLTPGEWALKGVDKRVSISRNVREESGGVILLLQDITEAHAMEAQLQRHKRLSAMGEMAAALAHQLRTPLSTALLYTSNLRETSLSEEERNRFIEKALGRLRHLEGLIKDMLVFVRGSKGAHEPLPVEELVSEVRQVIEPQMVQLGMRFTCDFQAGDVHINGSREAIAGALTNLLANAMQACAGNGIISLSTLLEKGKNVVFVVKDNGGGIPPDILERLFEPFFTTRTEGTGLGLAIVREVAQMHGGDVSVKSRLGHGSEFYLRLPKVEK